MQVTSTAFSGFKSGKYKQTIQSPVVNVPDGDCTEANLESLIGVLSLVDPGEEEQRSQVCCQISAILQKLTKSEETIVTLQNVLQKQVQEESIHLRVHQMV